MLVRFAYATVPVRRRSKAVVACVRARQSASDKAEIFAARAGDGAAHYNAGQPSRRVTQALRSCQRRRRSEKRRAIRKEESAPTTRLVRYPA